MAELLKNLRSHARLFERPCKAKSFMGNHEPSQSLSNKSGFYYGNIIVLCAFISMVAILILPFSYGVFFKPMATEFGWNRTVVSGAYSLSRIIAGMMSIAMGWLIDKMGARIVLVVYGVVCGLGFLLIAQIDTVWQLYLVYGVIIGSGTGIFAPMVSLVAKWFVQRRATMTGIVISSLGVATLVGPPITNLLISGYGWLLSYEISGIVIAVIVIIAAQFMRRNPRKVEQSEFGEKDDDEERLKLNNAFSLREAVCTRQFWVFFLMSICYAFCYMAVLVHVIPYITDSGIASAAAAANVLATIGGASAVGFVVIGNIGDRIGNKNTIIIGFILLSLAMFLLLFIREIWLFYLFAVILGLAMGAISPQRPPMVAMMFGVKSHGLIFGAIDNSFMIGSAVGPILAGYIFDITGNYLFSFLLNAAVAVLGLVLIISLRPAFAKTCRVTL